VRIHPPWSRLQHSASGCADDEPTRKPQPRALTRKVPQGTIHYALAAAAVRRLEGRHTPGDLTVEEMLELGDTEPDESRYYAGVVAGGWGLVAFGFIVAMGLALPVGSLRGDQAANIVAAAFMAAGFFCLAGAVNGLWHIAWHVPQARRRLRDHGADSEAFKTSMHRSIPRNTSLIFQTPLAIALLALGMFAMRVALTRCGEWRGMCHRPVGD
jgi:hypothetical protein